LSTSDNVANAVYVTNGKVQIGIDINRGGTIFHFSEVNTKKNLVNHFDEGREIQQSYYGWPDGSTWSGVSWVWNPVQGGGSNGTKGKVISSKKESTSITVTSQPVLWASGEYAKDCVMTEFIELVDNYAHINFKFEYSGKGEGNSRHQELPAFFVDWDLNNFVWYDGDEPWTKDELSSYIPEAQGNNIKNEYQKLTESWAAYVNDDGWGIGIYSPKCKECTLYRFGSGPGGALSSPCSYVAPIKTMAITPGFAYSYDVYLTIGTRKEIRDTFYEIHEEAGQ